MSEQELSCRERDRDVLQIGIVLNSLATGIDCNLFVRENYSFYLNIVY